MLHEITNASRRFDVIGYGEFERRYMAAKCTAGNSDKPWFDRLEGLVYGLDMKLGDIFDARREQIKKLSKAIDKLNDTLSNSLDKQ